VGLVQADSLEPFFRPYSFSHLGYGSSKNRNHDDQTRAGFGVILAVSPLFPHRNFPKAYLLWAFFRILSDGEF